MNEDTNTTWKSPTTYTKEDREWGDKMAQLMVDNLNKNVTAEAEAIKKSHTTE